MYATAEIVKNISLYRNMESAAQKIGEKTTGLYCAQYCVCVILYTQAGKQKGGSDMAVELTEAGREAKRKYYREYRARKREAERDKQNRYWNNIAEKARRQEGAGNGICTA